MPSLAPSAGCSTQGSERLMWSKIFGCRAPERTLIRDVRVGEIQSIEGIADAIDGPFLSLSRGLCRIEECGERDGDSKYSLR